MQPMFIILVKCNWLRNLTTIGCGEEGLIMRKLEGSRGQIAETEERSRLERNKVCWQGLNAYAIQFSAKGRLNLK